MVDVRSTRGKNARGHKVTGLAVHGDKLLVTSNDSRIRMYDVRDKALTCKFKVRFMLLFIHGVIYSWTSR